MIVCFGSSSLFQDVRVSFIVEIKVGNSKQCCVVYKIALLWWWWWWWWGQWRRWWWWLYWLGMRFKDYRELKRGSDISFKFGTTMNLAWNEI